MSVACDCTGVQTFNKQCQSRNKNTVFKNFTVQYVLKQIVKINFNHC